MYCNCTLTIFADHLYYILRKTNLKLFQIKHVKLRINFRSHKSIYKKKENTEIVSPKNKCVITNTQLHTRNKI